jgi:hypothetical protein
MSDISKVTVEFTPVDKSYLEHLRLCIRLLNPIVKSSIHLHCKKTSKPEQASLNDFQTARNGTRQVDDGKAIILDSSRQEVLNAGSGKGSEEGGRNGVPAFRPMSWGSDW